MLELIIFGIIVGCVFIFFIFAGVCYLIKSMSANLFLVRFNSLLNKDEFIDKKTIYNLHKRYAFAYRLFNIFHNDNINEYAVASLAISKSQTDKFDNFRVYMAGLACIMQRVNVVPKNNFIKYGTNS